MLNTLSKRYTAAALTLALLGGVAAHTAIAAPQGMMHKNHCPGGAQDEMGPMDSMGPMGRHDKRHGEMGLRGLNLSEAQRDQIFKIRHEQEPALHEKMKTLHRTHQELRQLGDAEQYSSAKVKALADEQARTLADLTVMRAETQHRIFMLLTPEQKQQLAKQREARQAHRDARGGPDKPSMRGPMEHSMPSEPMGEGMHGKPPTDK